jgi:hypothetical protein
VHVVCVRDDELMQNFILETPYGIDDSKDLDACDNIKLLDICGSHGGDCEK